MTDGNQDKAIKGYSVKDMADFSKSLSLIWLPLLMVLFTAIAQILMFFMNALWWKQLGVKININYYEMSSVSFGILLLLTFGFVLIYGVILFSTFILIDTGKQLVQNNNKCNFLRRFINWINTNQVIYILFLIFLAVLPILILKEWLNYMNKGSNYTQYILAGLMSFTFCLLPLVAVWNKMVSFFKKNKGNNSDNSKDVSSIAKAILLLIGMLFFLLLGISLPGGALWLTWKFFGEAVGYLFIVIFIGHFIAYLYLHLSWMTPKDGNSKGDTCKTALFILLPIVIIFVISGWFTLIDSYAKDTKKSIIGNKGNPLNNAWILHDLMPFFRINKGDIYIENYGFFKDILNSEHLLVENVETNQTIKKGKKTECFSEQENSVLKDVQFLEINGSHYVFLPVTKEKNDVTEIGVIEVKDGKIIKFVSP